MDAAPRPAPPPGRVAEASTVLVVVLAALVAAAVFAGGGSRDDALATVGLAAVLCSALALGFALRGRLALPRLDRAGWLVVGASAALSAWAGLSIAWSIAGDRSWEWLDRGLVYLAFLALGVLAGAVADGVRRVAAIVAAVIGAALGWALLGVLHPAFFEDGDRIARLREPIGYWNGLAVLADAALVLGLWIARARSAWMRMAGALLGYTGTVALLLTQSRAGVITAVVVLAVWLRLSDDRLADALRTVLFVVPGLLVAAWAFTRPALVEDGALRADRVADGRWFGVFAIVGGLVVVAAARAAPVERVAAERERVVRTTLVTLCGLALFLGVVVLVVAVGNPVTWASSQLSSRECVNDPSRLTDLCSNNRFAWWQEALDVTADHPLGGSGAGTFELARKRYRDDATPVGEPHSVPLQLLADMGAVGLALGLLGAAGAAIGVRNGLRLASSRERPASVALACLALAYGIHALVDYDLDFLAVTAPVLVALGAMLAVGRPPSSARIGAAGLVAMTASTAAAAGAIALPALAGHYTDRAFDAADTGRIRDAVDDADRARSLDPLSPDPLFALANAADVAGDEAAAVAWYEEATRLQPENPDVWYELGLYHAIATHDQCAAYQALNRSYTLDPKSLRWSPGGVLDVAREAVDNGACERS
jgi:hypothetical protein